MEMKALQNIFIDILRSELTETELNSSVKDQLTSDIISDLYDMSKQHDLAHIVSSSLYKNSLLSDDDISSKFIQEEIVSVYRYEQMKYAYTQICDILQKADIPYIPLKGSVIRPYYPKESMRTSCDIDILVKKEDLDRSIELFIQNGFKMGEHYFHDVSLFSPSNIHLELHFSILETIKNLDVVLKTAWDHALPTETCEYHFSQEFFLFHMFAHMSYHFLSGGCGVKPLMDIWIMKNKMGLSYELASDLLEQAKILNFATEMSRLSEICFSGEDKDDFSQTLLSYIVSGGVYGTAENKIAVDKTASNSSIKYIFKRLFLPYSTMKYLYPVLEKLPILLPIFYFVRPFDKLFNGKARRAIKELQIAESVSDEQADSVHAIKERLQL